MSPSPSRTPNATDQSWPVPRRTTALVLFCCWLGILAEGYDVGVLGAVLPALAEYREWGPLTKLELGALGSQALIGMLIGALFIGTLSDLIGRKKMLLLSMLIFTTTQLGAAFAPTPEIFGLFRLLGGLGMGGIIPVAAALTIEYSPPRRRALNYGIMYSGYSLGIVAAALVALLVLDSHGWRWVIGIGSVPVLLIPILALMLPESMEYLVQKGKIDQARTLADRLRIRPFRESDWVHPPAAGESVRRGPREVMGILFSRPFAAATAFFWISLFCGMLLVYGLNTWLPSIMKAAGYQLGSSLMFLLVFSLASAAGGLLLGWMADRWGRKLVLVVFFALGAVCILGLMNKNSLLVNYGLVAMAGIGSISVSLVLTAWVADYYPAYARATAVGWALSFARIGAIAGPIVGGWIAGAQLPFQYNFVLFAVVGLVSAIAIALIPRPPGDQRRSDPPVSGTDPDLVDEERVQV
ncbi:MFS transporter [Enemella evansiae]|uniref:MFS transporter n=1 Tax=Enemella evansiae TaxID=2016499 RepID=A0A255GKI3_9ACTN|nr:aromatic acid/H+ symport family MFS transporter [Enemella evansiae]PFG65662.1 AAHS family benzoate transporter-like MFS transporter [Propionibacteriaceae bacterium ES.041]OYN96406.1 MFS transporter [Enemella evansiae]OYN98720.1 MFS transporter [Enemella evansiae]OYO01925.1 MFS transporter [Enemella evansiae]OYO10907.1 MFS transporter [Enemella evansiae]